LEFGLEVPAWDRPLLTAADGKSWIAFAADAIAMADDIERPATSARAWGSATRPLAAPRAFGIRLPAQGFEVGDSVITEILSVTGGRYIRPGSTDPVRCESLFK
jgi:hypothetical protein